jgi:hypothetical protein
MMLDAEDSMPVGPTENTVAEVEWHMFMQDVGQGK